MADTELLLSSGFLAFAAHAGFLRGVEAVGLSVGAMCGTSSGALVGSLWAAGRPAEEILRIACGRRPLSWVRPHLHIWRGLFRLDPMIAELERLLPPRFEDLPIPFAVGVVDRLGTHRLVSSGPLAPAVAASCAVPYLFVPVELEGEVLQDGAVADRTGLAAWRAHRGIRPDPVVHMIARTAGVQTDDAPAGAVVHSPASGARLWSLGDVAGRFAASARRTEAVLGSVLGSGA